jgi:hypothetical protein
MHTCTGGTQENHVYHVVQFQLYGTVGVGQDASVVRGGVRRIGVHTRCAGRRGLLARMNIQRSNTQRHPADPPWPLSRFTFTGLGPLGIVFGDVADSVSGESLVVVNSIRPGSAASQHVGLVPGLVLHAIQDCAVCGENFDQVLARIKAAGCAWSAALLVVWSHSCDISLQSHTRVCTLACLAAGDRSSWCCVHQSRCRGRSRKRSRSRNRRRCTSRSHRNPKGRSIIQASTQMACWNLLLWSLDLWASHLEMWQSGAYRD